MPIQIETSITNPVLVSVGIVEPPLTDVISKNGEPIEVEEVKFYMRPLLDRHEVIEGESGESRNNSDGLGNVKYKWAEEDVAIEGQYMGWWWFLEKGAEEGRETPEFPILISDHGPGSGVRTGAIADGIGDHMPTTYAALRKDPNFGERRIQKIVQLVQLRVLKEYVEPDEETNYPLVMLDYFSKRVALELCTPGIDYWARQHRSITATSPNEVTSFPNMVESLKELRDRLCCELKENWEELSFFIPELKQRKPMPLPGSSLEYHERPDTSGHLRKRNVMQGFVSKDPNEYQPLLSGFIGNWDGFTLGFFPYFP